MARPTRLPDSDVDQWLAAHPEWARTPGPPSAIARELRFADFASALGFVVRVGAAAEKHDHHPDLELGWGRVRVLFTTHDAGGLTTLDLTLATACDEIAASTGVRGAP